MTYDWSRFGFHIPEILLPKEGIDFSRWAVVACDQYTSEPEYWEEVEKIVGEAPSTLRLMLPELFLEKEGEAERIAAIRENMKEYMASGILRQLPPGCMLVRRTAEGRSRLGLVIAVDLEAYDYNKGSQSLIRATEGTVVSRIPPRLRIRNGAPLELPHIIILIDDPGKTVIEPLEKLATQKMYDTDLMMEGGHIVGHFIPEADLKGAQEALSTLLDQAEAKYGKGKAIFQAMGDGNHSLATAKANWENLKQTLSPEEAATHPARYALCEIENVHDDGIVFEPIHRVLFAKDGKTGQEIVDAVVSLLAKQNGNAKLAPADTPAPAGSFVLPYITAEGKGAILVDGPSQKLEVGVLQAALDELIAQGGLEIDYIHGTKAVENLSNRPGNAGFTLPAMDKSLLFPAVAADGALPRKTFSMGEANEKRFYIEGRKIL